MRRPNLCNNSVTVADDSYAPTQRTKDDRNTLSVVRRVLNSTVNKKKDQSWKVFGVPLTDLSLTPTSVPAVLHNLCLFIEKHGMEIDDLWEEKAWAVGVVDELKVILNSTGDMKLELESWKSGQVTSVASLLVAWLTDLPQPLVSHQATAHLITLMHKYPEEDWMFEDKLVGLGVVRHNSLERVFRMLHMYTMLHPNAISYLPVLFAPIIIRGETQQKTNHAHEQLMARFILSCTTIFKPRLTEMDAMRKKDGEANGTVKQKQKSEPNGSQRRKRKERQDSVSLSVERKFVRSNSEERPVNVCGTGCGDASDTIRRVSSHEDFSKSRTGVLSQVCGKERRKAVPLHEHNSQVGVQASGEEKDRQLTTTVGYASDLYDEAEHERRRNSERFAQAPQPRRRRTKHYRSSSQAKENELSINHRQKHHGYRYHQMSQQLKNSIIYDSIQSPPTELSTSTENTSDQSQSPKEQEERSASPISGVSSPILDITRNTLHDPQPVTAWNTILPSSDERMVSPRTSLVMAKRTFAVQRKDDPVLLELEAQINNFKRKLKKYEEGFEKEFGFKPSHSDKMANPDTKHMCAKLSKLRKQLKNTKEDCARLSNFENKSKTSISEELVKEIEKKLSEKRGVDVCEVDEMSRDAVIEEKSAMQKALLGLEATYGRPDSREERECVRRLYDRYRALKRALLKHAPSKVKDSVSELGTILEHEAMEFNTLQQPRTASPSSSSPHSDSLDTAAATLPHCSSTDSIQQESLLQDLHALPPQELVKLGRVTREEKKRLRRSLREYEDEFLAKTGRKPQKEDRNSLDSLYQDYKNAKAKLRFIDALVTKIK